MNSTLSRLPPWPVWSGPAQAMLRAMLGELEGLPITGGEASVRLSPEGLNAGRWLAGFSPAGVSSERLQGLPQRLGMSSVDTQWFTAHWRSARQIGLAVEQARDQVVAKVYLEYALPAPELRARPPEQRQVALQIQSCKWRADLPEQARPASRQTEYWRMSGVDGAAIVQLLRDGEVLAPAVRPVYAAVAQCLQVAQRSAPYWRDQRLLLVREAASQAVGLRLYGSQLRASAVLAPLKSLCEGWGLDLSRHPEVLSSWAHQELGWIHAGLDARAQGFVIVYGALNRAQTRAVLSAGGLAPHEPQASLQENWK